MAELIRINKRVAELGLASRREADALIADGKVLVNGKAAAVGQKVSATDTVTLKGTAPAKQYLAYYKGRGIISHSPEAGETDIATRLARDYQLSDVHPIGRLDKDSEGLMLLSNDGRLTGPLLDSSNNIEKEYEVEVDKQITNQMLSRFGKGITIEGYKTKPAHATKKSNKRLRLVLTEGKKHQIRRMCAALGYQVLSLKRVRIANIELKALKPNQYRKLTASELRNLFALLSVK
jgi:23S rRNA pseudouridine2604 synthase